MLVMVEVMMEDMVAVVVVVVASVVEAVELNSRSSALSNHVLFESTTNPPATSTM